MSVYTPIPNQPLGWSSAIPTDECGCEKHQYCSPMLFTLNEYVYDAYVARAVADGALATDIPAACQAEIRDTFYTLSEATRYVSDPFTFLYEKAGEDPICDNMPSVLASSPTIGGGFTTIVGPEDEGYVAGQLTFVTDVGDGEPIEQNISIALNNLLAPNCVNRLCVSIIPSTRIDQYPWEVEISDEDGFSETISSGADPSIGVSACYDVTLFEGERLNIRSNLVDAKVFQGFIRIVSLEVECEFEPIGFVTTEDGVEFGEILNLNTGSTTVSTNQYFFVEANIGINSIDEVKNNCYYLKVNSGCCCTEVFYSKCIKPIADDCHTVGVEFWQNVTPTDATLGFGFYYPAATSGNEFKQFMRVWGEIRNPQYDGELEMYEDSFGRKSVVYAESREFRQFIINYSPEYVHNALRLACRHDNFVLTDSNYGISAVNFFTRSEAYSPSWIRISKLAPVTIEVEKKDQRFVGGGSKTFC